MPAPVTALLDLPGLPRLRPRGRRANALIGPRAALRTVALGLLPLGLAAGVWRVERDQPGWVTRSPGPSLVSRSPTVPSELPRLVLGVYYGWYGTPGGPTGRWRHWNHARLDLSGNRILGFHDPGREAAPGRLDLGATHYPESGPYDSQDGALVRAQVEAARAAGLDGFAVSWWGRERERPESLARLLRAAHDKGLVVAPYYETGELWPRGARGVAADLRTLLRRHGAEPAWLRVGGVPVVFLYAAHRLRPRAWDAVLADLGREHDRLFLVTDVPRPEWLARQPGWLDRFDAVHVYTPVTFLAGGRDLAGVYARLAALARARGRPFVPAVGPGFDDRRIRTPGTLVARLDGRTYDATWTAALASDPPWVLVSTWNEWHEGSEIEPSREHGRRYLEATRAWASRFRQR